MELLLSAKITRIYFKLSVYKHQPNTRNVTELLPSTQISRFYLKFSVHRHQTITIARNTKSLVPNKNNYDLFAIFCAQTSGKYNCKELFLVTKINMIYLKFSLHKHQHVIQLQRTFSEHKYDKDLFQISVQKH